MAGIFKGVKLKTLALLLSKTSHRRAAGVTPSGVPPVSRPTRPAQGPSAEGPGSPDGLRCASRGDQSPHVPPCPPGGLGGKGSFLAQGPKASKVSVKPFQRLAVSKGGAFGRSPQGAKCFSEGSLFFASFFLRYKKKEGSLPPHAEGGTLDEGRRVFW